MTKNTPSSIKSYTYGGIVVNPLERPTFPRLLRQGYLEQHYQFGSHERPGLSELNELERYRAQERKIGIR